MLDMKNRRGYNVTTVVREEVGNDRRANIPRLVDNFPQYSHSIIVAHVLKADVIHL